MIKKAWIVALLFFAISTMEYYGSIFEVEKLLLQLWLVKLSLSWITISGFDFNTLASRLNQCFVPLPLHHRKILSGSCIRYMR